MKRTLLLLIAMSSLSSFGQSYSYVGNIQVRQPKDVSVNRPGDKSFLGSYYQNEVERKQLLKKQYLTRTYKPCYVDDFKTLAFLRYNHFSDQMEFVKGQEIYYLKKEQGRTVYFTSLNATYKVFNVNGKLGYFVVKVEGKNSLLVRQSSKYVPASLPKGTYKKRKPADFKRNKDRYFIAFSDLSMVEVPAKKRAFYKMFKKNKDKIKEYVENNKLNIKVVEDIEKIVRFSNEL